MASRFEGDVAFSGAVRFIKSASLPEGTVLNADIGDAAGIAAKKMQHRRTLNYGQADGADVVSETKLLYIARATGTLNRVEVRPTVAPTGGDLQFTVDIQKASDGSGTWTSLLDSVITLDSSSVDDTLQAGVLISSPTLEDGDAVRAVITASGSTGSQGQGFVVSVDLDEDPS